MISLVLAALFWSGSQPPFSDAQIKNLQELSDSQQQIAVQVNDLAGRVHSESDASALISLLTNASGFDFPHLSRLMRQAARAEYQTATGISPQISEDYIAIIWNDYVRDLGAADETYVNAAEVHALHDAVYTASRLFWANGNKSLWTVPNLYTTAQDGRITNGCRFLESVRLLQELRRFDNLRTARDFLARGTTLADTFKEISAGQILKKGFISAAPAKTNPVAIAENRYIEEQGMEKFKELQRRTLEKLLANFASQ